MPDRATDNGSLLRTHAVAIPVLGMGKVLWLHPHVGPLPTAVKPALIRPRPQVGDGRPACPIRPTSHPPSDGFPTRHQPAPRTPRYTAGSGPTTASRLSLSRRVWFLYSGVLALDRWPGAVAWDVFVRPRSLLKTPGLNGSSYPRSALVRGRVRRGKPRRSTDLGPAGVAAKDRMTWRTHSYRT